MRVFVFALLLAGCASAPSRPSSITDVTSQTQTTGWKQEGIASWYGREQQGHLTANGEHFDMYAMTAAHRTLPMHTRVRVTHKENGRSVVVRINDRGPYSRGRIIDLSYAAAKALGMIERGLAPVRVEVLR